ncbi:low molecular weight protein-tyrosine-phosphatase [Bengtsoniella intestinalis]|uniref:low molecular weight protein-tyrosine-phosphatase n=1 Tax=Bengtsoniella intestinalis TaxID=3073143 RepID=UPI00391F0374
MISILFICHGNICRSTMAECVMKDLIAKAGKSGAFVIDSAGTSREEIGNPIHHGTRRKLQQVGVPLCDHRAVQMTKADYQTYDYILAMDSANIRNSLRITGGDPEGKIKRLLDLTERPRDIADPWYTGNFDETYRDVLEGCQALLTLCLEGSNP